LQFEQNSRTVGDAAVEHQLLMRESFKGLGDLISSEAVSEKAEWPFFTIPLFELHAQDVLQLASLETLAFIHIVTPDNRQEYLDYTKVHREASIKESHEIRYGNLDHLVENSYHPYITYRDSDGFKQDNGTGKNVQYPLWQVSPRTYMKILAMRKGEIEISHILFFYRNIFRTYIMNCSSVII
jgi:hypothetical protein